MSRAYTVSRMARPRTLLAVASLLLAALAAPLPGASAAPDGGGAGDGRIRYDDLPDAYQISTAASAWPDTDLTYSFLSGTNDVSGDGEQQAMRDALALWAAVTPLTFTEVSSGGDIQILHTSLNNHGDGSSGFGAPNGVLAHAFFPPPNGSFAGDAHFDDGEAWTLSTRPAGSGQPIDLVTVAAHEFGHSLGLPHSSVNSALMAPFYNGSHRFLSPDDIDKIQDLYGEGGGGGGTPSISIADKAIVEGDSGTKALRLKLTLSAASASDVTVRFTTSNGSATAPGDYKAKNVTVTIPAGSTSKLAGVVVIGDAAVEPNETFTVTLSSPVGATIADGSATATITNDD
jgi:hypothetical protein